VSSKRIPELISISTEDEISHAILVKLSLSDLCCYLYCICVRILPVLVRLWWSDLSDRSMSALVESFTIRFISPWTIRQEINGIVDCKNSSSTDIFQIKASMGSNDITAVYRKEEIQLTITIRLPPSYPLKCVEIEGTQRYGISEPQWRKWLLSMNAMLMTQVYAYLSLWRNSL